MRVASEMIFVSTWATRRRGYREKAAVFPARPQGRKAFLSPRRNPRHTSLVEPRCSYWRYYNWSMGDGALVKQSTHRDFAPNSAESLLVLWPDGNSSICCFLSFGFFCSQILHFHDHWPPNVLHDRHICKHPQRTEGIDSTTLS